MEKTFGQILKEIRRSRNITQRELADNVGVDFSYISKIENDRLPPPAADTIGKISEALGISNEILFAQSGKVSQDVKDEVLSNPNAIRLLNELKVMNLTENEWSSLFKKLKRLR
jgi:transcriptional regulator with XRE-family HTH domain